jgi:two-component system response regulator RegA
MNTARQILVVEDDPVFGDVLSNALRRRGFAVTLAASTAAARSEIDAHPPDYAIVDLRIGTDSGLPLIPLLAREPVGATTVVLTGYGSIATAVEAIKLGATQYLTKPVEVEEIVSALQTTDVPPAESVPVRSRPLSVKRLEWEHIQRVLQDNGGNISATARALGIHRRTLQRKLHKRPVRM